MAIALHTVRRPATLRRTVRVGTSSGQSIGLEASGEQGCGIARLILVNGAPGSGKSTLARRYVDDHTDAALVEVDILRVTLPNWEQDPATRLTARELAVAAAAEHLGAGRSVVLAQYLGRVGYIVLLEGVAREHGATFVEVILATGAGLATDRFRARRRALLEHGEHHPECDIADTDVEAFILDAVERLTRLPTARPQSRVIPVAPDASEDEMYRRLRAVLVENGQP